MSTSEQNGTRRKSAKSEGNVPARELHTLETTQKKGAFKPTLKSKVRDIFQHIYLPLKLPDASVSTLRQYHANLNNFDEFLGHEATVEDFQDEIVLAACSWFAKEKLRSRHSARKLQDNLASIWRVCARKQITNRWPEMKPFAVPILSPIAWSKEELFKLFEACQRQEGVICGIPAHLWWTALHSVLWDSAERISAVLSIKRDDVNMTTRWAIIHAEFRKGKTADNPVRFHPDTCAVLRELIENTYPEEQCLFPWPYDVGTLYNHYKTLLRRADLPGDRYHKFHALRRSSASFFEAAGGDATKLLGHSARRVTEKYLDPRIVEKQHASDLLFRPDEKGGSGS